MKHAIGCTLSLALLGACLSPAHAEGPDAVPAASSQVAPQAQSAATGTLSAVPPVVALGGGASLSWECQGASSAYIQPGIGPVSLQGTLTLAPSKSTDYTLGCSGPGGTETATAKLVVQLPQKPVCTISATPALVSYGEPALLAWECSNASSAVLQPGLGEVPVKGSRTVTLSQSTTYLIKATGDPASESSSAAVQVALRQPAKGPVSLDVQFATGRAEVQRKYRQVIGELAAFLRQNPGLTGTIEGHTDNMGDEEQNLRLSQRRAESIRHLLVRGFGIDGSRVTAVGHGATKPRADNATAEGRSKNRRVMVSFEAAEPEKK